MKEVVYINIKGNNATRKTTNLLCLREYMESKGAIKKIVTAGLLYEFQGKKYFFFGFLYNTGWFVGIDGNPLEKQKVKGYDSSHESRHRFFGEMIKKYDLDYVITEGYFCNHGSVLEYLDCLLPYGITRYEYYFQRWKTLEKSINAQIKRCETNNTSLENSKASYRQEINIIKKMKKDLEKHPHCIVEVLNVETTPNDIYVRKLFNDTYPEFFPKDKPTKGVSTTLNQDEW